MDPPPCESESMSAFNRYIFISFNLFSCFFRNRKSQNTVLKFCMDIFVFYTITNIEASACAAGITFTADIIAFLVFLVFVKTLGSGDGKITILQLYLYFIFLKSWKIYICLLYTSDAADE